MAGPRRAITSRRWAGIAARYGNTDCRCPQTKEEDFKMSRHHERASSMHTDRTRDASGELRQKRGDTLGGNIEKEYDVDFGVRSDMRLDTLRDQTGLTSIEDLLRHARGRGLISPPPIPGIVFLRCPAFVPAVSSLNARSFDMACARPRPCRARAVATRCRRPKSAVFSGSLTDRPI